MHGANRLGGNGVANSTVFGGIAGDTMPKWIAANAGHRAPDEAALDAEMARALRPFGAKGGDLNRLRERLLDCMWDDVGVIRDRAGLDRALSALDEIEAELLATGVPDGDRAFNLSWHDWLNLRSLTEVSRVIALAACRRQNSRGAHFREDFPEPGDLESSTFTVARQTGGQVAITDQPVLFTIVRPGDTLLAGKAAAE
jgi:fumarate reductase flavoprotein subunit